MFEHLQRLLAGDVERSEPAADTGSLKTGEGTVPNFGEDGVGAVEACDEFDSAFALCCVVLEEGDGMTLRIGDHGPFCFSEVGGHLRFDTIV